MLNQTQTKTQENPIQLQRVKWLAETLNLSTPQAYKAISKGEVPPNCIFMVGRRIRVIEARVKAWIEGDVTDKDSV